MDNLKENIMIKAVIMAGGSGTRLWPLSWAGYPKQFLRLHGGDTMLQSTMKRLESFCMLMIWLVHVFL